MSGYQQHRPADDQQQQQQQAAATPGAAPPPDGTPGANGTPNGDGTPPDGADEQLEPGHRFIEVTATASCLFCESTDGCKVRADGEWAGCLRPVPDRRSVVGKDGRTYYLYTRAEMAAASAARAAVKEPKAQPAPEGVVRFLGALFEPNELFTVRYVETWTEGGKKRGRIVYTMPTGLERRECLASPKRWAHINQNAGKCHANIFFGVCPRPKKGCERSWHIRTVRCLWADIDHSTPDDVLKRCETAGLPRPSIVVSSGNGAHLYWLLTEPVIIDDAGELRPIGQSWVDVRRRDGTTVLKDNGEPKRRPRNYVAGKQSEGEPQYIWERLTDERTRGDSDKKNPFFPSELSPKAQHVQDVVQGLAKLFGGDHTHDLARLLRLPDTMNRKDGRNGKPPTACLLVECDPTRRYPFADFEKFAALSPDKERREKIAAIRLPSRKLTPARLNNLNNYINRSATAEKGQRSEADFGLCCYALRKGFSAEEIWEQVATVGKFAEAGRRYFDLTWKKADQKVRQDLYEKTQRNGTGKGGKSGKRNAPSANGTPQGGDAAPGEGDLPPPGDVNGDCHAGAAHDLPDIITNNRQLRDVTKDALDAVRDANDPPRLFQRGSELCRLKVDPDTHAPALELLDDARVCNHLARVANWIEERDDGEEVKVENVPPPPEVVRDVRAMPAFPGIPPVRAVVECPTFSHDGELVVTPGYHAGARLLYHPAPGLAVPEVSERPTAEEVKEARRLLMDELYGDFPFVDAASKAHAITATIQPFARPMIDGPTPQTLYDAPVEGTGKTLCVTCATLVATGREPEAISEARDDDEWRKRITATLSESPTFVFLDNINRTLDSGALASALTATTWKDRILGVSRTIRVPNTATWLASGNNTRLSRELIRRTLWCRLDAKQDAPWERTTFRHPRLIVWAKENRGKLVWAVLTLCRAWIVAGRPKGKQTLGMFESWAEVMGGVLDVAGIPGLLANAKDFRKAAADQTDEWRAFVAAWWAKHGRESVGVQQLFELAKGQCLLDSVLGDREERSQRTRLGWAMRKARDRVCGAYRIEYRGEDNSDRAQYGLTPVESAKSTDAEAPSQAAGDGAAKDSDEEGEWEG
jgi:hypothetical protein